MFGTQNLSVFLLAAISLIILPGADTLYIICSHYSPGTKGWDSFSGVLVQDRCFTQRLLRLDYRLY